MSTWKLLIDGEWITLNEQIDVINPSTGELVGQVPKGGTKEATRAVEAAYKAFPTWSRLTANERSQFLMKWHELIQQEAEQIAKLMTAEQGKPLKEALGEVAYANSFLSWYAEEGKRIYGETIPASVPNKRLFVHRQPVGVIAAITPWNFPAAMITRKIGPALASGCTAVIKPAEQTPLTALYLAKLAEKAGIPAGVINVVTGDPKEIGEAWMSDERVRKVTFTGSTEVGKLLMRQAADTVKKLSLELGGHAPFIVMKDANLELAADGAIASKFRNAGQTCVCANRIYVHQDVMEPFLQVFTEKVNRLVVGDGLEAGTDIGPLINEEAIAKVRKQVHDAKEKGADVLVGGEVISGLFYQPTIVANATDEMTCMNEETFGPVAPVSSFDSIDEVIKRANDSRFGLAAYVYTENLSNAIRVSEELQYGIVGINDAIPAVAQAPFGGFKESGLGREGGHHGIEEFLETKYISLGI
ncbi:NAD-dependent succinate-semialdehyde dehydrogenase [Alkalihalobacillus sp. MEB130]|uniref:NAD-dependent succinate-semialdehyde dehydrogenase n=1 Tax=Alkalihalobacillus sp. MEB130 TaxID=2976704 RepID=UPI0028E032C4|nr:NAD-dependent succinate-semialdehyde dehydrogenase [Alkalihalobacillus sp. MEB130]MDT8860073.1 NAD-dependent succinate-semialdehyde dehydrogenase [Alkalihalobacillus sp. MEB130]